MPDATEADVEELARFLAACGLFATHGVFDDLGYLLQKRHRQMAAEVLAAGWRKVP
jgi:hypothetical protein